MKFSSPCSGEYADICWLQLGPFVDSSHPLMKSGDVDETPQQIFQSAISPKLSSFLDYSLNTTVILVPSVRDLISHNVVYPQAPLEREGLNLHKVGAVSNLSVCAALLSFGPS